LYGIVMRYTVHTMSRKGFPSCREKREKLITPGTSSESM